MCIISTNWQTEHFETVCSFQGLEGGGGGVYNAPEKNIIKQLCLTACPLSRMQNEQIESGVR